MFKNNVNLRNDNNETSRRKNVGSFLNSSNILVLILLGLGEVVTQSLLVKHEYCLGVYNKKKGECFWARTKTLQVFPLFFLIE